MHPYITQQIMVTRQRERIGDGKSRGDTGSGRTRHKPEKGRKGQTRRGS